MAGRFEGWRVRRGSPTHETAARKLLGELAERRDRGAPRTLKLRKELADGSVVTAEFAGEVPIVHVEQGGRKVLEVRDTLMQGFVAKPYPSLGTYGEVLLDNEGTFDVPKWNNLFFDSTYDPVVPTDPKSGHYRQNRHGDFVFKDGLRVAGNLDWRNADETFVVTFFGSTDRYFGYGDGITFDTRVFINGDCLVDIQYATDIGSYDPKILGACVRELPTGPELIWCAAVPENFGYSRQAQLLFYRAPLKLRTSAGVGWAADPPAVPVLRYPRFAAILSVDAQVIAPFYTHSFGAPDTYTQVTGGHLMAFNQAATEGKMFIRVGNGSADRIHEITFNFADFDACTFDDLLRDETFVVHRTTTQTDTVAMLAATRVVQKDAISAGVDGEEWLFNQAISPIWPGGYYEIMPVNYSTGEDVVPDFDRLPAAVDYKNNVAVYAYTKPPASSATGTVTNTPTQSASYSGTFGEVIIIDAANTTTLDSTGSGITNGLEVPWALGVVTGPSSTARSASASSSAHIEANLSSAAIVASTYTGGGTDTVTTVDTPVVVHYCDLRNDSLVYSLWKTTVESVLTIGAWHHRVAFENSRLADRDRDSVITTTRTLQTVVHLNGITLYDSGVVAIDTTVDTPATSVEHNECVSLDLTMACTIGWNTGVGGLTGTHDMATAHDVTAQTALLPAWGSTYPSPGGGGLFSIGTISTTATTTGTDSSSTLPINVTIYRGSNFLYDGTAPLDWVAQTVDGKAAYGYWPTRKGDYVLSMPWPATSGALGWLNAMNGGDIDLLTGHHESDYFYPVWVTTRFAYEHSTE